MNNSIIILIYIPPYGGSALGVKAGGKRTGSTSPLLEYLILFQLLFSLIKVNCF